ncbi:MAG: POT family MFS transporter [Verrucomicrobiota bacterium]
MPTTPYRDAPIKSDRMPPGIPYIVGNEAAERFSYYGMRTILVVYMTQYLMGRDGQRQPMNAEDAKGYYHLFMSAAYFFPVLGAILSDALLGKYRTIMGLSIVYCFGHLALAMDETRTGLAIGLTLIALGSGGIKPCVSAHVGDQFGESNRFLLTRVYGWFYFAINFGAFISTLLTPYLLEKDWAGPQVAFGVPGALMLISTWVFWLGRYKFVHIRPAGMGFIKETFSPQGLKAMAKLVPVFLCVAMFWALYDQTGSSWVLQAAHMDLHWMGIDWFESQIQATNPVLVLVFIPLFSYWLYPTIDRFFPLTPLRKMGIGFFVMLPSFLIVAWIETRIGAGLKPNIVWQLIAYVFLTAAEVMIYQTGLEFAYTQAPRTMKSLIMAFYLLAVSLGNLFTAGINFTIKLPAVASRLAGANYYLFFAALMLVTAIAFVFIARLYQEETILQVERPAPA